MRDVSVIASETLCIDATHPALAGHFPGNPLVPGVVLLTRVIEAVERLHDGRVRVRGMPTVKFLSPMRPNKAVMLSLISVSASMLKFECRTEEALVATGSIKLEVSDH